MFKKVNKKKIGVSPGTIIYTGEKQEVPIKITAFNNDEKNFSTIEVENFASFLENREKEEPIWINIDGLHNVDIIKKIGEHFKLHNLILEDVVSTQQRPKIEIYPECAFIVLRQITYNEEKKVLHIEQISIILGKDYVISFQETSGDVFDGVRTRLRNGKIIPRGMTYLAYTLIDSIVDHYFIILEKMGEEIEELEDSVVTNPVKEDIHTLHYLKREVIFLRKSIWPLREVVKSIQNEESSILDQDVMVYFRDVYDHIIQVMEHIEVFREMLSSILDIYLTSINNKMNEIMKVLTFIATIFIPLSFVAGVYGMNFDNMPELKWEYGYHMVWFFMITISACMVYVFKRKKWL